MHHKSELINLCEELRSRYVNSSNIIDEEFYNKLIRLTHKFDNIQRKLNTTISTTSIL